MMRGLGGTTTVIMPSQEVVITYTCEEVAIGILTIIINYEHPTKGVARSILRQPSKHSFSQKYFEKELDTYVVQEAMSDLMDNRHSYDWVE